MAYTRHLFEAIENEEIFKSYLEHHSYPYSEESVDLQKEGANAVDAGKIEEGLAILKSASRMGNSVALVQVGIIEVCQTQDIGCLFNAGYDYQLNEEFLLRLFKLTYYFYETSSKSSERAEVIEHFEQLFKVFDLLFNDPKISEAQKIQLLPTLIYLLIIKKKFDTNASGKLTQPFIYEEDFYSFYLNNVFLNTNFADDLIKRLTSSDWQYLSVFLIPTIREFVSHRNALFQTNNYEFEVIIECQRIRNLTVEQRISEILTLYETNPAMTFELLNDFLDKNAIAKLAEIQILEELLINEMKHSNLSEAEYLFLGFLKAKRLNRHDSPNNIDFFESAGPNGEIIKRYFQILDLRAEENDQFEEMLLKLIVDLHEMENANPQALLPFVLHLYLDINQRDVFDEPDEDHLESLQKASDGGCLLAALKLFQEHKTLIDLLRAVKYDFQNSVERLSMNAQAHTNPFFGLVSGLIRIDRNIYDLQNLLQYYPNSRVIPELIYQSALVPLPEVWYVSEDFVTQHNLEFMNLVKKHPEYVGELVQLWNDSIQQVKALLDIPTYQLFLEKRIAFLEKISQYTKSHKEQIKAGADPLIPVLLNMVNEYDHDTHTAQKILQQDLNEIQILKNELALLKSHSPASKSNLGLFNDGSASSTSSSDSKEDVEARIKKHNRFDH